MTIKEALLKEIDALPENRQADVLTYVRFIKSGLGGVEERRQRFLAALTQARETAAARKVTDKDISDEIEAVRRGRV